jgi:hypothetical protein
MDGTGAERMLGLPGLVVLDVEDVPGEVVVNVESTRKKATCPSCRRRAQAQDRVEVHLRDLHCFGRPTRHSQTAVALHNQGLREEDLDREDRWHRPPPSADA